jgi:putative ABC transport system permease protein
MVLSRVINLSLKGLSKYRMRTFLMMLGIIIGIATLTVIVSVSKGMQKKITKVYKASANAVMISAGGGRCLASGRKSG